ncbi:Chorismate--pyruvate lyase [Edwardsiella hoshinae]|uniref:Chorismate pyruvate-lyase n=2 Tax=Edwardsiella hoshinae TaxID=93378 RepID=A0A376DN21_9GAMM|nr:Chorismate--pyruvate lyase [Edwardsiella hoshinae]
MYGMAEQLEPLRVTRWQPLDQVALPPEYHSWLAEPGSMTRRLEQHCMRLEVRVLREAWVTATQLRGHERAQLPEGDGYWLREVQLCGDGVAWLFGRTLIPAQTLTGEGQALRRLGNTPLGRYLFSGIPLQREAILVGHQGTLWARCSRLRVSGQLLLLTELFLADAPIYDR